MRTKFIPQQIDNYHFSFALRVEKCILCDHFIMKKDTTWNSLFGAYGNSQYEQMENAGIRKVGGTTYTPREGDICEECANEGKGEFRCALCEKVRPTNQQQWKYGNPTEHLCKTCYETTPAKEWERIVDVIEERHRYDYE